jgi:hypothetical protein
MIVVFLSWLKEDGSIPTRAWFLHRLCHFFPGNIAGQSLCAGGATALAKAGVPLHIIQAISAWSSDAFQIYIHCYPALLAVTIFTFVSTLHLLFHYLFSSLPNFLDLRT